jgi:WD40 repeat protein
MATVGSTAGELVLWDLTKSVGQVVSSKFVAPGGQSAAGSGNQQRRYTRIPLCVDRATATTIWVGHKSDLLGFHPNGGRPRHVLKGHLHHVTAMEFMDHSLQLLTAAADGMILTWGKKRPTNPVVSTPGQVAERQRLQDEDNW